MCTPAKHKIILSWPKCIIFLLLHYYWIYRKLRILIIYKMVQLKFHKPMEPHKSMKTHTATNVSQGIVFTICCSNKIYKYKLNLNNKWIHRCKSYKSGDFISSKCNLIQELQKHCFCCQWLIISNFKLPRWWKISAFL